MDFANWIYLATGLGVGLASRWLLPPKLSTDLKDITPQQLDGVLPQTQLAYLMAQQTSQFKGGFLARTSHELRSPLSNIIGLHQLILSDLCDDRDEERQFVAQAHEAALQLVKLIDEILNVARLEHGTNKLEIQPLQLSFVLEEVCNILRMIAANRSHKLQLSPPPPEIYVLADPLWLRQIILTLIDAAISCKNDGGGIFYLSVQLIPESNFVYIWIDTPLAVGTWNDPVDLLQGDRLFGDFSCEASLTSKYALNLSSPGLALLLVQTLLEVMQGKLEIFPTPTNSETSPATRMQISIPLLTPDTALLEIEP